MFNSIITCGSSIISKNIHVLDFIIFNYFMYLINIFINSIIVTTYFFVFQHYAGQDMAVALISYQIKSSGFVFYRKRIPDVLGLLCLPLIDLLLA